MRKSNNHPFFEYWEDRKLNGEFSVHFSHGGRIPMTSDNKESSLVIIGAKGCFIETIDDKQ